MSFSALRVPRPAFRSVAAAALLLAGCASVTPIGELLQNSCKEVRIKGEVKESAGLLGKGAYQVKDDTGTLTVISEISSPPPTGSRIGVKGVFQALLTFGSKSLAVLKEHSRFE